MTLGGSSYYLQPLNPGQSLAGEWGMGCLWVWAWAWATPRAWAWAWAWVKNGVDVMPVPLRRIEGGGDGTTPGLTPITGSRLPDLRGWVRLLKCRQGYSYQPTRVQ